MLKLSDIQLFVDELQDESHDAVKQFISRGGYFQKFIQVLRDDEISQKVQDSSLVFAAITPFITRSQDDLVDLEQAAIEASQEIVSCHLKTIEKLLCSDRKYAVIGLKLLTGIVNLNYDLAKEILLELQITPDTMDNLASNQKARPHFMDFVLSFIAKNSSTLFSFLINKSKNMFNSIVAGLVVDDVEQVIKFLSTLENFLKSVSIPDSLKLNAFHPSTLGHLLELYRWQGPTHFKKMFKPVKTTKKPKLESIKEVDEAEKQIVRDKAHEFLMMLCTSEQYGIVSTDLVFKGALDESNGHLITTLKTKLVNEIWSDNLQAALLIEILKASPNLFESTFTKISVPSTQVLSFLHIVQEVVENSKCHGNSLRIENYPEVALKLCLPSCICPGIKASLESTDCVVRYAAINFLITSVKKLKEYILIYSSRKGPRNINNFIANYIRTNVASAERLSIVWSHETKFENVITKNGEKITEEMYFSSLAELLILCSDLSFVFASAICQNFSEISYDACLFFSAAPFLKVFSLLIYLNKIDPTQVEFRHGLQKVIVMMITEQNDEAKELFYKLMTNSRFVEGVENELVIWVHCFSIVKPNHALKIAELFSVAVEYLANNATELCRFNDSLDEKTKSSVSGASNIEELISKVTSKLGEFDSASTGSVQLNMSLLLLAFLQNLTIDKRKINDAVSKSLNEFITNLVVHCFHSQFNPEAFTTLITQDVFRKILPEALMKYVKSWLSNSKKSLKGSDLTGCCGFNEISIESQLIQNFQSPDASQLKQIHDSVKEASPEHLALLLRFCIFTAARNIRRSTFSPALSESISSTTLLILRCLPKALKEPCTQFILAHPILLEAFSPTETSDDQNNSVSLILPIVEESIASIDEKILSDYLAPYKFRFLKLLKNEIGNKNDLKGNKKVLLTLITCLKLADTDALEVIEQIFSHFDSLTDTWSNVVALLLEIISENKLNKALPGHLVTILCTRLPNKRLQQAIMSYFSSFPHSIEFIPPEFIKKLLKLQEINSLGVLLISLNPSFMEIVIDVWDSVKSKPGIIFPVLSAISGNSDVSDDVLKEVVLNHLSDPSKLISSSPAWFLEHNQIISQLVYRFIESGVALKECDKIEEMWFEFEVQPRITPLLETLFNKAGRTLKLTELLLNWVVQLLSSHKYDQIGTLLETIGDCCVIDSSNNDYHSLTKLSVWSQFVKLALKHGLVEENKPLLNCLAVISKSAFSEKNPDGAQGVFDLMTSHSNFIKLFLSKSECKDSLIKLFFACVSADSSLMKPSHIALFLGAYSASLSVADQLLLQILYSYEKNGVKLNKCQPYIWGEAAVSHFTIRSKAVSLHKQLPPVKLLDLLDTSRIEATIKRFPLNRNDKSNEIIDPDDEVYDPAFLIPVLNCILNPESTVRWFQLTRSGALSIILASLSLSNPVLRNSAYLALSKFYQHLQTGQKARVLWVQLLDIVRNGVAEAGLNKDNATPQLPSIITTFLARTSLIMIEPSGPLFQPLVSFITVRPALRLNQIPEFLILFFSGSKDSRLHRKWLLEVIKDGMKREDDWEISQKSIFKLMLTFYSSSLADDETQELILAVMESTAKLPRAAIYLATGYGFISWLSHVIHTMSHSNSKTVPSLTELLNILGSNLPLRYAETLLNLSLSLIPLVNCLNDPQDLSTFITTLRILSRKARLSIPSSTLSSLLNCIATKISSSTHQTCQYLLKYGTKYSPSVCIDSKSHNIDQHLMALFTDYL